MIPLYHKYIIYYDQWSQSYWPYWSQAPCRAIKHSIVYQWPTDFMVKLYFRSLNKGFVAFHRSSFFQQDNCESSGEVLRMTVDLVCGLDGNMTDVWTFHSEYPVNQPFSLSFLVYTIPALLLTLILNIWCIRVIQKSEETIINSLIIWDCVANILFAAQGTFQQTPWSVMELSPLCCTHMVLYFMLINFNRSDLHKCVKTWTRFIEFFGRNFGSFPKIMNN